MDTYSPAGTKVIYNGSTASYVGINENWKFLERGKEYTVARTDVSSCYTKVYLKEFPNSHFNAVWFNAAPQTPDAARIGNKVDKTVATTTATEIAPSTAAAPSDTPSIDKVEPHDYATALLFLNEDKRERNRLREELAALQSQIDGAGDEIPNRDNK